MVQAIKLYVLKVFLGCRAATLPHTLQDYSVVSTRNFVDTFWVNSSGYFLMVITNGAKTEGAGAKTLLGSANTVQCQG